MPPIMPMPCPGIASSPASFATFPAEDAQIAHRRTIRRTRLFDKRLRLDSVLGLCCRRHFQKNSLMSGTLLAAGVYSNDLS